VVSFTPWLLYPQGKGPQYPLYRRLGGPQNQSVHGGERKIHAFVANLILVIGLMA
jgi:hypothetical protein